MTFSTVVGVILVVVLVGVVLYDSFKPFGKEQEEDEDV